MPTHFLTYGIGSHAPSAAERLWRRPPSGHVLGDLGGQRKSELRTARGSPAHRDPPAVRLDETAHQVQPETRAAPATTLPEPGEHPLHVLFGDALALVGHRDAHHVATRPAGGAGLVALRHLHGHRALAVADGVLQQVAQ